MRRLSATDIAHDFLKRYVREGDTCIDATAGRGKDTLFLCELVGEKGNVLAFDIQEEAIESTKNILKENNLLNRAKVVNDSHENMESYCDRETVSGIIFNLGYLPGGDHKIATNPHTTIKAIESGLNLLKENGVISLSIYHGGNSGFYEKDLLMKYLKEIESKKCSVFVMEPYNKVNPPISVFILKNF